MRLRRPFSTRGTRPPGEILRRRLLTRRRERPAIALGLALTVGLCALAVCGLSVPELVLGAQSPQAENGARPAAAERPAAQRPSTDLSSGELLVTLPWGGGEGEVGLVQPAEGLSRGPEALAVAPDGRIAVLDSVNRRLVFLGAGGELLGAAALPLSEPRFLAVDDQQLYVLDCDADRALVALDWTGVILAASTLPELSDVVTGLFATAEGPCVEIAHEDAFLIAIPAEAVGELRSTADSDLDPDADLDPETEADSAAVRGGTMPAQASLHSVGGRPLDGGLERTVRVTFAPGENAHIRVFRVEPSTMRADQRADFKQPLAPGRSLEHLVSVDGDGSGGFIIGARLLDSSSDGPGHSRAALILTRLVAPAGTAAVNAPIDVAGGDTLLLTDSTFTYLGQPYVIGPDGHVFQPVGSEAGYGIVVHSFAGDGNREIEEEVQP